MSAGDPVNADIRDRLGTILARAPLRLAALFGSAATGRERADSDLDIAILPLALAPELDDLSLQSTLTLAAGREVDLIRIDRASTLLKWQIAKSALPLFEAFPGEIARFRARAAAEWADFGPTFERHAEHFRRRLIQLAGRP